MSKIKETNRNGNKRGMSPNSRKNLTLGWKRDNSNSAKRDYSITRIIKDMLDDPADECWLDAPYKGKGLTWRQVIAKRVLVEATKGNAKVIGELLDRLEGKVSQPIQGDGEVTIRVVYDN